MIYTIVVVLLSLSFVILTLYLVLSAWYVRKRSIVFPAGMRYPRVSILKPVKDIDDDMVNNLETFYNLEYPDYEIVFGLDRMDSECTNVIRKIKEEHPQIPTHIVCQTSKNVLNPKIEVLASMESTCTGELVWVSDSNVRVEPDTLKKLVHEYVVNDAKIVFSPIRGTGSCTVGSVMENASINLFVSGSIIAAYKLSGQHIIVGKSMLIEKKSLDTFGGFSHFREYLAEDFLMGEIFTAHKIYISSNFTWITNYNSHTSIGGFFSRMSRWAKMRFHIRKWVYILEILTNPVALAALSLVFLGADGLGLLGLAVVFKIFIEYADLFFVNPEDGKKWWVVAGYPLWVVIKDLIVFFVYCAPFFSSRVNWRGRIIRIGKASRIHLSS